MLAKKYLNICFLSFFLSIVTLVPKFTQANNSQDEFVENENPEENDQVPSEVPEENLNEEDQLAAEQNPPHSEDDEDDIRMVKAASPDPQANQVEAVIAPPESNAPVEALKPQARSMVEEKPLINRNVAPPSHPRWEQELDHAYAKATEAEQPAVATNCSLQLESRASLSFSAMPWVFLSFLGLWRLRRSIFLSANI